MSNDQRVRAYVGEKEGYNIVRRSGDQSIVLYTLHSALYEILMTATHLKLREDVSRTGCILAAHQSRACDMIQCEVSVWQSEVGECEETGEGDQQKW